MRKVPKVSIIIPVYNRSHTLSRALDSVLNQTFEDFEIILVDDGSTDDLNAFLIQYTDSRLRVIKHPQNKGASAARNTGIKAAHGHLIAFLDSDDEWHPLKLETQLAHFDKTREKNKNMRASFTWFYIRRKNGFQDLRRFKTVKNWRKYFLEGCFIGPGSTLLVDKGVYDEVGLFDESFKRLEDWDWCLRFSKKYDMGVCQSPLSIVHQGNKPFYQDVCESLHKLSQKQRKELSFTEKMKFYSACQRERGYSYVQNSLLKSFCYLLLSILLNPCSLRRICANFIKKWISSKLILSTVIDYTMSQK